LSETQAHPDAIRYAPNPKQTLFHADPRERRWFCAGYGTGKTTAGVMEAFQFGWNEHPRCEGILAAPTYPLLSSVLLTEWAHWIPREYWTQHDHPKKGTYLRLANGTIIWCRSTTQPANNEGINAAWLVFDEAPREHNHEGYSVLVSRIRRGVPGRRLGVVLTGPPAGPGHWTAKEFGTGAGGDRVGDNWHWHDDRHAVIRARTADNPYLPEGYEEGLRTRPGATKNWCRQYLDAEFVASEGQIYEAFSRDVHIVNEVPSQFRSIVIAVDWGYSHYGSMIVLGVTGTGTMYAIHEERHRNMLVSDSGWLGIAEKLRDKYRPARFVADPSEPGYIMSLRQKLGGRPVVENAANDVAEGIRRVAVALDPHPPEMKPRLYIHRSCAGLIEEIEGYTYRVVRGVATEAPIEVRDDSLDALRYAVMSATRHA
jgi:phage terminase large subunit